MGKIKKYIIIFTQGGAEPHTLVYNLCWDCLFACLLLSPAGRVCTDLQADINQLGLFGSGRSHQSRSDKEEEVTFTPSAALIIIIIPDK